MIIVELSDDGARERRYSDKNVYLLQVETGILYEEAVDVIHCRYTYEESDVPIGSIQYGSKTETSRDLTDEETEIYEKWLESESIETGVKLF